MCISGFMVYELLSKPLFHLIFTDEQIQYHCANVSGAETERPTAHRWCGRARAPEQAGVLVPNSYRRANQLWDRGHTSCLTDGSHHLLLRAFLPNFSGSRVWSNLSVQFSHSGVSDSLWPHCSTPGFPVHHQLPEHAQTHVHWVGDAIQPSHPLSSTPPPTFNLPQHQGLFQWVSSSHQVAKVLEFHLQHQSLQWLFRIDFLQG